MYMDNTLDDYVHDHLQRYIKYHLDRGYSPIALKKALIIYGYPSKAIDNIIKNTKIDHHKIDIKYTEKELKGETYYFLRGILADYIKDQMEHGFELPDIKKALIKYGHQKSLINDAIGLSKSTSVKISHNTIFFLSISLYLLFCIAMALSLETSIISMILVMSPSIISFILSSFIMPFAHKKREFVTPLSVVITIVLFMFIFPALENAQAESSVLMFLNGFIVLITTYFYSMTHENNKKK